MPAEILMPQQSDTMTEGTVVRWLKKEGDKISAGDVIAEIETDKATMEMEAFESGTLAHIAAPEGTKVPVGQAIGFLATKNEKVEDVKKQYAGSAPAGGAAKPAAVQKQASAGGSGSSAAGGTATLTAPPERAKVGNSVDQGTATFRGASMGEMHEPDEVQAHGATREDIDTAPAKGEKNNGDGRIKVSPLARRIAAEHGIDVAQLQGSGPGGRIVKQDVLDAVESGAGRAAAPTPQKAEVRSLKPDAPAQVPVLAQRMSAGAVETIPLSKMRSVIAKRLQQSKQQIPHFYETVDIDVEDLTKLRARLNEQFAPQKIKLSLGDLIAKAIATALEEHPALNAHFNGAEITRYGDVNLGMAVALPEGLIVPVLRGVNHMGFREIRVRSADLVERARAQKLKQDEMTGATFTVSNLGMFGVREFSAIINPPEVAILAVGGAEKRAVVRNDQIVARTMMTVTLSCDHRAVDGATAAEFLGTLRQLLEEPAMMLAEDRRRHYILLPMSDKDLIADVYRQQGHLLAGHLGDFTEADMLVRPAESANHAAWQVGHLAVAFGNLINMAMPGAIPPEPQEFVDRHTVKGCRLDDGFATKAELLKKFNDANEHAIEWMLALSDADKARPIEKLKGFAPTVGHLVHVIPNHVNMHLGQIQVIRRKLGKPVIF